MQLDLPFVRQQFPGLRDDEIYFDNAGGSLTLGAVADRIHDYLLHSSMQLGATYPGSTRAAERYQDARARLATFTGARAPEEIVFGPSSTVLLRFLAEAFIPLLSDGDEIIVSRMDHEANVGCWIAAAARCNAKVVFWEPDEETGDLELPGLRARLSRRTRLVTVTHVSNIRGTIHDIAAIAKCVHEHGARICVDGVAYAPHRRLDVTSWDVDFYVYSLYKVYGPHFAILYGKHQALLELGNLNHYFFQSGNIPGKLEPGNANYELAHGSAGIADYLEELGHRAGAPPDTGAIPTAFDAIARHEESIAAPLLEFLRRRPGVKIIGHSSADRNARVPTISFTHDSLRSDEIVAAVDPTGIGIRYGHFYAIRLIEHLGLTNQNGVVRVSMVHYNTIDEVHRLLEVLDDCLR